MKSLLSKIKKESKLKNIDQFKELEIELVRIKNVNNPNKLESELKELYRIHS